MPKEVILTLWLAAVRVIFRICRVFPLRNKTVMLSSFGDNIQEVIHEVNRRTGSEVVVLKESGCSRTFEGVADENLICFSPLNVPKYLSGIYHLATAKVVFVDSYHVVLAACDFKKPVTCVQLWHANGAVKLFGLKDKTITKRPASAHRRFKAVYRRFDKVTISSNEMGEIFKTAFGLKDENMLKTGVPRSDFFYSEARLAKAKENMRSRLPQAKGRKVILYAPTFREAEFAVSEIPLDIERMEAALGGSHHLLVHLHPAVNFEGFTGDDFVTDVSKGHDIFELLSITDILITDYSSIPFEFSALSRPMIFYPYDFEKYEAERGLWFDYESFVPGPVVYSTEEIIRTIKDETFNIDDIRQFDQAWNKYAGGEAAKRLIDTVYRNAVGD